MKASFTSASTETLISPGSGHGISREGWGGNSVKQEGWGGLRIGDGGSNGIKPVGFNKI